MAGHFAKFGQVGWILEGRLVASFPMFSRHPTAEWPQNSSRSSVFLSKKRAPLWSWNDGLYQMWQITSESLNSHWLQIQESPLFQSSHFAFKRYSMLFFFLRFLRSPRSRRIFSEVTNVEIKKQPDGTSRGFAFVTFAEKVSSARAISPGMVRERKDVCEKKKG